MNFYIKSRFFEDQEERIVIDENGKRLFKVCRDLGIKLGEMGAIVMTLQDEELYTIAEKKMTCLVYRGEELIAECIGGSTKPYMSLLRRIYRIKKGDRVYQLKGNWLGFDFTNETSLIDIGHLEEITITVDNHSTGAIHFTEDNLYELNLESGEDPAFWIAVLVWVDYQLALGNKRR